MKFSPNDDVVLVLKITDERGKRIRVKDINDIKIKVYTQSPDKFLHYTQRDIKQKSDVDMLAIPDFEMSALPSGVVTYEYRYNTWDKDFNHSDRKHDRSGVVVTDIYWKNKNISEQPSNPINYQSLEYIKDLIDKEENARKRADKEINDYLKVNYNEALENETNERITQDSLLENDIERLDEKVNGISDKLNDEIQRANSTDIELFKYIKEVEQNGAANKDEQDKAMEDFKSETTDIVNQETDRAKAAEKELKETIDNEILERKQADILTDTKIDAEVSRAKTEESRIESKIDTEIDRAKEYEKHIQADIDDEIKRAKEVEQDLTTKLTNAINECDERSRNCEQKASELLQKVNETISDRDIKDNELTAAIQSVDGKVNDEIERAKLVEKDIAESLQQLKQSVNTQNTENATLFENLRNDLAAEIGRSTAEDERHQTALDTLNGDIDTVGSVAHSIADSEHKMQDAIDAVKKALNQYFDTTISDYVTKEQFNNRIEELIGGAPAAFDTLMELYEALQKDGDAIKAINEVLTGKANADDVYTKAEIDKKESDINIAIENEEQRATLKENEITAKLDKVIADNSDLTGKVNDHISAEDSRYNDLNERLTAEVTRSQDQDTKHQNALDIINGDEETIGSIKHALSDAKHYADEAISNANLDVNNQIAEMQISIANNAAAIETEVNRAKTEETRIDGKIDSETERAKLVENDLAQSLAALKQSVNDKNTANDTAISEIKADIVAEVARAQAKETEIDTRITTEISAAKTELNETINDKLTDYATKSEVDERIKNVIGTAPEALDTLGEIADMLQKDDDAIKVINEVLTGKADKDSVYTKAEIDKKVDPLTNAIEVINGEVEVIGSIKHAVADSNHYTDDEIEKLHHTITDEVQEKLDEKQDKGEYIEFTTDEDGKHVILPNDANIAGTTANGLVIKNLVKLDTDNNVQVGDAEVNVNINGASERPTYNGEEMAKLSDVESIKNAADEEIAKLKQEVADLKDLIGWAKYE